MARKDDKARKDDDDDDLIEEVEEELVEEEVVEEEVVEEEVEEEIEAVEAEGDEGAKAEAVDDEVKEDAVDEINLDDDEPPPVDDDGEPPVEVEAEEEEEPGPAPQTPVAVLILAGLNILAAGAFVFLLLMDLSKRSEWSYAIFLHDLDMLGLPLESESGDGISGSREGRGATKLTPEQIKQVFSRRGGSASEPFQHVDEAFANPILPEHLTEAILADVFQGVGPSVKTLEDEVRRLKTELPGLIDQAAKAYAASVKDKRKAIEDVLLPLSINGAQVELIAKRIKDAPANALDEMLVDAAHRRLLVDILAPLDIHRPAKNPEDLAGWKEQRERVFDNAADANVIKLDDLKNLLIRRLDSAIAEKFDGSLYYEKKWDTESRTTLEKRPVIAYLLVTISHAKKLDGTPLIPPAAKDRAQVVVGWYEYNNAVQSLTASLMALHQRVMTAIRADRTGQDILVKGEPAVNRGFIQKHMDQIEKLKEIYAMVQNREQRLQDLQIQLKKHSAYYKDRAAHRDEVYNTLLAARKQTAKAKAELNVLQKQWQEAQENLRTAVGVNLNLNAEIRRRSGLPAIISDQKVP